jgi:amphi-Trp domain-containing protein
MAQKDSLAFRNTVPSSDAAGILESIAKALREGSALLESGDKSIGLQIGPTIKVELDASSDPEKGKGAIELSLSWRVEEQAEAPPSLEIVPGALIPAAADADGDDE